MVIGKRTFKQLLGLLTFALVLAWALNHSAALKAVLSRLLTILSPFLLGLCIAFVVNVLLRLLEGFWEKIPAKRNNFHQKMKRPVCLLASWLLIFALILAVFLIVIPELKQTFAQLIDMMPTYLRNAEPLWHEAVVFLSENGITLPEMDVEKILGVLEKVLKQVGEGLLTGATGLVAAISDVVIGLIFSIYVLAGKEKLSAQMWKLVHAFLPRRAADRLTEIVKLTERTFRAFVSGQLTEAVILGALCFLGMVIFGFPYAPVVGVLIGFTALIPIFGAFIGAAVGAFLILLVDPMKAVWFIVYLLILQQLEGNLIYPRVVGKSVGLPGIFVLMAVTIGGSIAGVVGMLLGVPTCSVLYTLLSDEVRTRLDAQKGTPDERHDPI